MEPKILIEPLMSDEIDIMPGGIGVYCFEGEVEFILRMYGKNGENEVAAYDKNLNIIENIMKAREKNLKIPGDELVKQAFDLSVKLAKPFNFVRVDWMIYQNKLYFEELTFTPYSGFMNFKSLKDNLKFGELVKI